jgi:hypothetical protein
VKRLVIDMRQGIDIKLSIGRTYRAQQENKDDQPHRNSLNEYTKSEQRIKE